MPEAPGGLAAAARPDVTTTGEAEWERLVTAGGVDWLVVVVRLVTAGGAELVVAGSTEQRGSSIQASEWACRM